MRRRGVSLLVLGMGALAACQIPAVGSMARPAAALPRPAAAVPVTDDPTPPDARVNLVTYNTWGKPGLLGTRTAERFERLQGALGQNDWVTLQEAFSQASQGLLGLPAYPFPFWHRDGGFLKIPSGLLTLSRHKILAQGFSAFAACVHADCLSRKGVMWTRLALQPGLIVDVYNTHYQAEDDARAEAIRKDDNNRTLAAYIKANDQGYPTFLQGDFNFHEGGPAYTDLKRRLPLHDLWRETKPTDPGWTWDPTNNPNHDSPSAPERLDYVFYLDNPAYAASVDSVELAYTRAVKGMVLSDHFGLALRLALRKTGK